MYDLARPRCEPLINIRFSRCIYYLLRLHKPYLVLFGPGYTAAFLVVIGILLTRLAISYQSLPRAWSNLRADQ